MNHIGSVFQKLDGWIESFSIEVFASVLKPQWVDQALESTGRRTKRVRKLPASLTMWLVIAMGFYRNLSIENILHRMGNVLGMGSLWEKGKTPTSASTVEARDRLGFGPLRELVERFRAWLLESYREQMSWKGLLLLALDGTTFKVPDSDENRRRFGLPGANRSRAAFPQMRALFLASTRLRFILTGLFAPYRRAEIHVALRMLPFVPEGSLVIMDRNFTAWEFLLHLRDLGSHFLVRAKKNMKGVVLDTLGPGDRLVSFKVPGHLRRRNPSWPKRVMVREISARIKGKDYRYFTSLLDPNEYKAKDLVFLYSTRWEEETAFDEIKTHQCGATTVNRPVIFRCLRSRRVLQEAYGLILAYNLVRVLMAHAGERTGVPALRISFVDSLERIRSAALLMAAAPTACLPVMFEDLLHSIAKRTLPLRQRDNPREVCVKMSKYRRKRKVA